MKIIIDCPVCRKKSRVPADKHLRYQCPRCSSIIEVNRGKIITFLQWTDPRSRPRSAAWRRASGTWKELLAWIKYELFRPDRWLNRKRLLIGAVVLLITAAGWFGIRKYRNVRTWRQVQDTYLATAESTAIAPEARAFVLALLERGRQSGKRRIVVRFRSELDLKDWLDYPLAIRNGVDSLVRLDNRLTGQRYELPGEKPPPSIKGKIATERPALEAIIVATLQRQFDAVFDPNPVSFIREGLTTSAETALATVEIDYRIETLTLDIGPRQYPNLYKHLLTFSTGLGGSSLSLPSGEERFLGYLLATRIAWQTQFRIPDEATTFATTEESRPNARLNSSGKGPYRVLMESAFRNYAFSLSEDIGLPPAQEPLDDLEDLLRSNQLPASIDSLLRRAASQQRRW